MMEKPGDVIIDSIVLKSYNGFQMDITGMFESITIFEDIYSNCMSGYIILIDSVNIAKNFPIIGDETLVLIYRTPEFGDGIAEHKPVSYVFKTYKVSVYAPETARENTGYIRLEFMSEQGIKSMQKKVCRSYVDMAVSDMVRSIYDEYLASNNNDYTSVIAGAAMGAAVGAVVPLVGMPVGAAAGAAYAYFSREDKIPMRTLVPTFDKRSYIIPYWNPFYAINWLCHRSRSSLNTNMCDYVFYENADGFHFTPLSNLKTRFRDYSYSNLSPGFRSFTGDRMLTTEMRNFISVKVQNSMDNGKMQALGMFSSSVMTFDATTKKWKRNFYEYDENFQQTPHLNSNPLVSFAKNSYSNCPIAHFRFYPDSSYVFKNSQSANDPDEIVLLRQSLLNQTNCLNLIAEAYGDSNLRVGQVIQYNALSKDFNKNSDSFENDYLKGNYLITAIRHDITTLEHKMVLTLSRDSYAEPLADKKKAELKMEGE
jgi:hypothetical protein